MCQYAKCFILITSHKLRDNSIKQVLLFPVIDKEIKESPQACAYVLGGHLALIISLLSHNQAYVPNHIANGPS